MLYDSAGNYIYPGKTVKTYDWSVINDAALPSWLVATGSSPVHTFTTAATDRAKLTMQTKVASPTSGDAAGVATAFNIATAQFAEIAFIGYGMLTDGASGTDHNLNITFNNGSSAGLYVQNNHAGSGVTNTRVYPSSAAIQVWEIANDGNRLRRKDIGIVIRPRTQEVFFCAGDPAEGAGIWHYDIGNWTDFTGVPITLQVLTRGAAQRSMQVERIKLRLVSY